MDKWLLLYDVPEYSSYTENELSYLAEQLAGYDIGKSRDAKQTLILSHLKQMPVGIVQTIQGQKVVRLFYPRKDTKMMTWDELKELIEKLPIEERKKKAVVFDYNSDEFFVLEPQYEGEPAFHLTIEGDKGFSLNQLYQDQV